MCRKDYSDLILQDEDQKTITSTKDEQTLHKIDLNSLRDSNKCTGDLVCVTDRLKHNMGSSNQLQADPKIQNTNTQVTSKNI